ncbi:MAG: PIN domain-containing protein [Oscillospiraceae bacterium]|jgi:predicted nucleic acid-binding protein|nr:PIN domain-containing protein [Oscillospiraceae bacterium]
MLKRKIYLDTSAISYLCQEDTPEKMAETLAFWEILKKGGYEVHISDVTENELRKCPDPKRSKLLALLNEIPYTVIVTEDNEDITAIEEDIKRHGILSPGSANDRLHIAAAIYSECSIIYSWNFRHFINDRTIEGARMISALNGKSLINILPPPALKG